MVVVSSVVSRNSTNQSFFDRHNRRASLLIHPHGLALLKHYKELKTKAATNLEGNHTRRFKESIEAKETEITQVLREAVPKWMKENELGEFSVTGEHAERVDGTLSQVLTTGKPDFVLRAFKKDDRYGEDQPPPAKSVFMILQASVDAGGGEKKIGQAFDYASLAEDTNTSLILVAFHVSRSKKKEEDTDLTASVKITLEAFLYMHNDIEKERKLGFLWREGYEGEGVVEGSCEGLYRCLECAYELRELSAKKTGTQCKWNLVSDNVAVGDNYVYKIFDNRFYKSSRKLDHWLSNYKWIEELQVKKEFEFTEGISRGDKTTTGKRPRNQDKSTPYPEGEVTIIRYPYVEGVHFASLVSHFKDIASCIEEMHKVGLVHGDIRGFNMLHPTEGGIKNSLLIDFDLTGKATIDTYPPHYATTVFENLHVRSGKACDALQYDDDWSDLESAMAIYEPKLEPKFYKNIRDFIQLKTAWTSLTEVIPPANIKKEIDAFIEKYGNIKINVAGESRMKDLEKRVKGTGSPNKHHQTSRGTMKLSGNSSSYNQQG
jgi:hypothetical protein